MVTVLLTAYLLMAGPGARWLALAGTALAGLVVWTLVEYVLHRFVLHHVQPFRSWHASHHARAKALIGTPTIASAALIATLVYLPVRLGADPWVACASTLGFTTGYFVYGLVHHAIHHSRGDTAWLRRRKQLHARHHYRYPQGWFGVTSAFWDRVFGSDPDVTAVSPAGTTGPERCSTAPGRA